MNNKNITTELFKVYPILKAINEKNNNVIKNNMQIKTLFANENISSAKGICGGVVFVVQGKIKIQRINKEGEETNLYDIKEGELCHEAFSCLLNYKSLNIVGTSLVDSTLVMISVEVVKEYLLKDSEFLSYMYSDLYKKFSNIIDKREEKIHEPLEKRLIKLLLNKNSNIIYATHKDLALEIDSTREVVSRKLKHIEKMGYIKLQRGKIVIIKDLNTFM